MRSLELKPTHKPVKNYYAALRHFDDLGVSHEGAVKSAFHGLLEHCVRQHVANCEFRSANDESQSVRNSSLVTRTIPARRNIIAAEIEKVISALTSRSFSRDDFSKSLEQIVDEKAREFVSQDAKL